MKRGWFLVFASVVAIACVTAQEGEGHGVFLKESLFSSASSDEGRVETSTQQDETGMIFTLVTAEGGLRQPPPSPDEPHMSTAPDDVADVPPFPVDFSSTESSLRTHILQANVDGAAAVLRSRRVISLGAGLTYSDALRPLVNPTSQRNRDPDVVVAKALAKSALDTKDADKLATAVVLSFTPDCKCSLYSPDQLDDLREAFARDFMDRRELQRIVAADANKELITPRRRLMGTNSSPVTSFVCASCWPNKLCKKMYWC